MMAMNLRELAVALSKVSLGDIQAEVEGITEQAAELRDKREKVSLQIIKLQEQARAMSADIRKIEEPLIGYNKLITLGVATGAIKGTSAPVATRRGTKPPAE